MKLSLLTSFVVGTLALGGCAGAPVESEASTAGALETQAGIGFRCTCTGKSCEYAGAEGIASLYGAVDAADPSKVAIFLPRVTAAGWEMTKLTANRAGHQADPAVIGFRSLSSQVPANEDFALWILDGSDLTIESALLARGADYTESETPALRPAGALTITSFSGFEAQKTEYSCQGSWRRGQE